MKMDDEMPRSKTRTRWWNKRRWFGSRSRAERARLKIFDKEGHGSGQGRPGAGVHGVDVLAIDNALQVERRYRRRLLHGQYAVAKAAASDAGLFGATRIIESDATRRDREYHVLRREQQRLGKDVDVSSSAVSARYALLLEVAVPAVEIAFWISTWMQEVDRREPWYGMGRVTAVLLAFAIPLLGVVCARFSGRLLHRVAKNYEGIDRADRIGAMVAAVLAFTAIGATGWLVYWRYESTSGLGGIDVPPLAMALIFSLMLLVIVAVRAFGVSELAEERHGRALHVRRERRADTKCQNELHRSAFGHERSWLALRGTINDCLNEVEHIYNRGGLLVLDYVAGLPEQPALTVPPATDDTHDEPEQAGYALPSGSPRSVLSADFQHPRRLRFVDAAIDVLEQHIPRGINGAEQMVDELRRTVWRLAGSAAPDITTPLPRNGNLPVH